MEKVKIICDTTADITKEEAIELGIRQVSIPITVDGAGFLEEEFTPAGFYEVLESSKEIPSTSHVTSVHYLEIFGQVYAAGYRKIICVTLNSKGSASFSAAQMASELFFEENPGAKEAGVEIAVVDGKSYSMGYGYGVLAAANILKNGGTYREALDYLLNFLDCSELYFSVFSLKYAKKSGRISAAAAFAGEMLGLRPLLEIRDGEMTITDKVRGNHSVIGALAKKYEERCTDKAFPYVIIRGCDPEPAKELEKLIRAKTGQKAYGTYYAGASIAINAGPDLVGVAFLGKKRGKKQAF